MGWKRTKNGVMTIIAITKKAMSQMMYFFIFSFVAFFIASPDRRIVLQRIVVHALHDSESYPWVKQGGPHIPFEV